MDYLASRVTDFDDALIEEFDEVSYIIWIYYFTISLA